MEEFIHELVFFSIPRFTTELPTEDADLPNKESSRKEQLSVTEIRLNVFRENNQRTSTANKIPWNSYDGTEKEFRRCQHRFNVMNPH